MDRFTTPLRNLWNSASDRVAGWWRTYRGWPRNRQLAVGAGAGLLFVLLVVGVAAALGGDSEPAAADTTVPPAPTTAPPTTATPATTTTTSTTIVGPVSPLNGLPAEDPALLDRRVMAIKIDNHPNARPQSGIDQADLMYELLVEGGLSRFIALFHDNDSDYVGPIRSGRVTDPELIRPLQPVIVISGAQPWIANIIAAADIEIIGEVEGTFRIDTRFAPHNLYGDTTALRATADARGYPDDPPERFFQIGEFAGTEPALEIAMTWDAGNRALWRFEDGRYVRFTNELPHTVVDAEGVEQQLTTDVIVVLKGESYVASPSDGDGSSVPAMVTTGSGDAIVFANGLVQEGTWSRESTADPFVLEDGNGGFLMVPPGRPWVAFFPEEQPLTWLAEVPVP